MTLPTVRLSAAPQGCGEPLPVDALLLGRVVQWIGAIPFESWPQQPRLADGQIRPAMVTDLAWESFGEVTAELVRSVTGQWSRRTVRERNRLLSVVMPGALIEPHTDDMGGDWCARLHVPLLTNPDAMFISANTVQRMVAGFAYEVDTRERHAVWNAGATPRVHLMFDLHSD